MIDELLKDRKKKVEELAILSYDLKEYFKYPCETVDLRQIHYQYGFVLNELKKIDFKIREFQIQQFQRFVSESIGFKIEMEKIQDKTNYTFPPAWTIFN